MKRVLQVIFHDPARYPLTLNTLRVLAARGHDTTCLGFDRGEPVTIPLPPRARIEYVNEGRPGYPQAFAEKILELFRFRRAVTRAISASKPDLVIAYDHWGLWAVAPHVSDVPVAYHIHDLGFSEQHSPFGREHLAFRVAERVMSRCRLVSLPEATRLVRLAQRHEIGTPTAIIANSPPRTTSERNEVLRDLITARSGTRPELLAVVVGNMGLLEESVSALAHADPRWHLAMVGTHVPGGAEALTRLAEHLGVKARFHYFSYTAYDTMRVWLRGCDVGLAFYPRAIDQLNQRLLGTGSVKVMEYLAAGLPIVVGRACSFEALAEETGALSFIETEDAEAIAGALDALRPSGIAWATARGRALDAHARRYNCEHQLAPVLALLE